MRIQRSLVFCALGTLSLLTLVAGKALIDQQTAESQASSVTVAQQRIGWDHDAHHEVHEVHDHHHEHHEHHHDPGFWKKKVTWKE
ncbi:PREDICTED: lysine-specific demethylase 7A-like, partial [Rhagoletis zephyria]|uniref:lysine-specific demethylase 7A-like n=1 Tax=Rhagoletis zephyria TaxID=28612 RepID=UPI000811252D